MEKPQRNLLDMFGRVIDFGAAHRDRFPETSIAGKTLADVTSAKLRAEALAASQSLGYRTVQHGLSWKAAARAALIDSLEAIERTAAAIALDHPGFASGFWIPREENAKALLTTATAFAELAAPSAAAFVQHGMRPTFLDDLNVDIQNFQQAIGEKETGRKTQTDATAQTRSTIQHGIQAVKRLDAIVRNVFAGDAETIRQWERACHVVTRYKADEPETEPKPEVAAAASPQS